jgi:CheY-like chemotaxis protein
MPPVVKITPSSADVSFDELASFNRGALDETILSKIKDCAMYAFEFNDAAPKVLIADDDEIIVRSLVERCRRMGFDVEPSGSGCNALIKLGKRRPNVLLTELDDRWPQFLDRQRSALHVVVVRGKSASTTADRAEKFETSHILKGRNFWRKFDAVLTEVFSLRKGAVRRKPAAENTVVNRPKVLLVDDDLEVRRFIFVGLRKMGIEPSFATDGILGFWIAKRSQPAVIISDYFMPNGDAECLLTRLRSTPETQNIPFIVQSGRKLSDAIKQRLEGEVCGHPGASMILKKSSGVGELFKILETMCGFAKATPREEAGTARQPAQAVQRDRTAQHNHLDVMRGSLT